MCRHPGTVREGWVVPERPENFNHLTADEQKRIDEDLESEILYKYYEAQVCKRAPRYWAVLQQKTVPIIRKPVWLASGVWENRNLFFLRESLLSLAAHWAEYFPGEPYPIRFDSADLQLHIQEAEDMEGVGQMLKLFQDQAVLPVDGMAKPEDYDTARENSCRFKDIFMGQAKDDDERELFGKLWPYQEGGIGS